VSKQGWWTLGAALGCTWWLWGMAACGDEVEETGGAGAVAGSGGAGAAAGSGGTGAAAGSGEHHVPADALRLP